MSKYEYEALMMIAELKNELGIGSSPQKISSQKSQVVESAHQPAEPVGEPAAEPNAADHQAATVELTPEERLTKLLGDRANVVKQPKGSLRQRFEKVCGTRQRLEKIQQNYYEQRSAASTQPQVGSDPIDSEECDLQPLDALSVSPSPTESEFFDPYEELAPLTGPFSPIEPLKAVDQESVSQEQAEKFRATAPTLAAHLSLNESENRSSGVLKERGASRVADLFDRAKANSMSPATPVTGAHTVVTTYNGVPIRAVVPPSQMNQIMNPYSHESQYSHVDYASGPAI